MKSFKGIEAFRAGSIVGCLALGAADIGRATVDGRIVWITWCRNLTPEQAAEFAERTAFEPVQNIGSHPVACELIIPDAMMEQLRGALRIDGKHRKMPLNKAVGQLVKLARRTAGLTQSQLAAAVDGLAQANLSVIESGEIEPRLETLRKIAAACGCDYKTLLP
jgi:DNA-binding XRE family transcriptional regulator